jgi:hypothetical protein
MHKQAAGAFAVRLTVITRERDGALSGFDHLDDVFAAARLGPAILLQEPDRPSLVEQLRNGPDRLELRSHEEHLPRPAHRSLPYMLPYMCEENERLLDGA